MEQRKATITKFSFKQWEKDEDPFLKPVIKTFTSEKYSGTMNISELWTDKKIRLYLT